jgi:dTDP-4-amino-4,6-dideoxygalactose transaminase
LTDLLKFLNEHFQGLESRVYGRATSGLYMLFLGIRREFGPGQVVVPSVCCESVAMAAWFAGLEPRIVGVDPDTFCLDPNVVRENLGPNTRAVVLAYVFGIPVDPRPFLELQRGYNFLLIEDLAQAVGGEWHGERLGCFGDYTMLSFAADKIVQGSAGALVRRTERGPQLDTFERESQHGYAERSLRAASLRNFSHSLYELARSDWSIDISRHFWRQIEHYRAVYLPPDDLAEVAATHRQLERLPEEREHRFRNYKRYAKEIDSDHVKVSTVPEGAMVWRAPLMASSPRAAFHLTQLLRQHGVPASNHYFPLDKLLRNDGDSLSQNLGCCLLNLWVDSSVNEEQIEHTVRLINEYDG